MVRSTSQPLAAAPAQLYETTVYNRDGKHKRGKSFSFVVVPARSLTKREVPSAVALRRQLKLKPHKRGGGLPLQGTIDPWMLPFAIDIALGHSGRGFSESQRSRMVERSLRGDSLSGPSDFAQYLAYSPVVPFESSPLGAKSLSDLAAAGGGIGGALGAYMTGEPLLLLTVPTGIIVCGAARGIGQALEIGLRAQLLKIMGVKDPGIPVMTYTRAPGTEETRGK